MNTRLQVEHPVTEMITGLDLVKEQIKVARGEKLSFAQEDLTINGHSFEVRVYAEDPLNNFLPDIGTLETYNTPKGPGIRVDDGFEQGMDIPIYYDPMIAKLIVHAENREAAIEKMLRAIKEYEITGVTTTLGFCEFALKHEAFVKGDFDTHFVKKYFEPEMLQKHNDDELEIAAIIGAKVLQEAKSDLAVSSTSSDNGSKWRRNRF